MILRNPAQIQTWLEGRRLCGPRAVRWASRMPENGLGLMGDTTTMLNTFFVMVIAYLCAWGAWRLGLPAVSWGVGITAIAAMSFQFLWFRVWKPCRSLDGTQIEKVAEILEEPSHQSWGVAVAQWIDKRPLTQGDLLYLKSAIAQRKVWELVQERDREEAHALARLMRGPVGCFLQENQMETTTAPAAGDSKRLGRL